MMRVHGVPPLAAVPLAAVLVAACGATAPASHHTATTGTPTAGQRVGLVEWSVITQGRPLLAGTDSLTVTNAGGTAHDLAVRGREGTWHTRLLKPGEHTILSIRTQPGETLRLWCAVEGHDAAGMETQVSVAGESPTAAEAGGR